MARAIFCGYAGGGSRYLDYSNGVQLLQHRVPGNLQPTGSAYPDLVFAAPSGVGSAPFPLVAIHLLAFAVQSDGGAPSVTVTSGQSSERPPACGAALIPARHLDLYGIADKCFVHLQSRHTQPRRRHAPIVDSDRFHGRRQHGRHGPPFRGPGITTLGCASLPAVCSTPAETPYRLLDDPCARRLHFAAVGSGGNDHPLRSRTRLPAHIPFSRFRRQGRRRAQPAVPLL